jgi:methylmalonyl-CoA mutase C-terminal domain
MVKLGLDSHWRGAVVVTRALCDAGMEVIFLGNQYPEAIAATAVQENVDVVGLSSLSGNHSILAPKVVESLHNKGVEDMLVILGGTIPQRDVEKLKKVGINEIFGPGTPTIDIVSYIKNWMQKRESRLSAKQRAK